MPKTIRSLYLKTFLMILCSIFLTGVAYSQNEEYKEYTVKKGDTLWDISSKEIVDPFLWPKVWKENPGVRNPDLIYPGQKIRIPLYLLQKVVAPPPVEKAMPLPEPKPEIKKEEPVVMRKPAEKKYLVEKDLYISSGYIVDHVYSKGTIIGAPTERTSYGKDDYIYVYIKTSFPVQKGDKFYTIKTPRKIKHPETGKMLGYLIQITGIAEVVGKESGEIKARVPASYAEIDEGSPLIDFYEMEPPLFIENPRTPNIDGFIVASKESSISVIVYVDRGRKDGIEVGDLLGMTARAKYNVPNGYLQVINTQESTATAIIRKYSKEVSVGDFINPMAGPS
jgi:LysM repeat protein